MAAFLGEDMRTTGARTSLISGAALGGALVWGGVELIALQWSRFLERLRKAGAQPLAK